MNNQIQGLLAAMTIVACTSVTATGLATCDSGPKSGWQPIEELEKQLTERGWTRQVPKVAGLLSASTSFMFSIPQSVFTACRASAALRVCRPLDGD
jgi:hypothetical protein